MKKMLPALLALLMLTFAGSVQALSTDEIIAVTAMPVAVAEVVALPEVPRAELVTVVTTLNRAAVPAPQFIEVVRYAPVALVDTREPQFVTYVTDEYDRGLVGEPLAYAIADRYDTYGIEEVNIVDPPVVTYVERQILPPVVVTRFQPVTFDPLALVAMPLAVAAVADFVDVPRSDLISFVSALNRAMMPAPQFVEVVRYSPVVFVDPVARPQFIRYVTTEVDRGIYGRPLAFAIADRLRTTYDPIDIDLIEPEPLRIVDYPDILPPVVVTEVSRHPHGGPPGQLKKELGLQTGAEVVHGTRAVGAINVDRRGSSREIRSVERSPRVTRSRESREPRVTRKREAREPRVTKRKASSPRVTKAREHPRRESRVTKQRPSTTRTVTARERSRPSKARVSSQSRGKSSPQLRSGSGGGGAKRGVGGKQGGGSSKGKGKGKGKG